MNAEQSYPHFIIDGYFSGELVWAIKITNMFFLH